MKLNTPPRTGARLWSKTRPQRSRQPDAVENCGCAAAGPSDTAALLRKQSGSILVLTLITAAILGIVLAGALELSQQQYQSVVRSQVWNSVMPACEAGVEEALAHLNAVGDGSRETNGWVLTNGVYSLSRTIDDFWYKVTITTADPPVVVSTGYIKAPLDDTNEITRTVQVNTSKSKTGMVGLVAKGTITLGPGSVIDSWDSRLTGAYGSGGVRSNAFVGSVNGSIGGGTLIKGDAATGPTGSITTTVTGSTSSDLSRSFSDVAEPFSAGSAFTPESGTVTVTNFSTTNAIIVTNVCPDPLPASGVLTNSQTITNTTPPASGSYTTQSGTVTTTTWPGSDVGTVTTNVTWTYDVHKNTVPANAFQVVEISSSRRDYSVISSYSYTAITYVYTTTTFSYTTSETNAITTTTASYDYVLSTGDYYATSISMSGQSEMMVTGDARLWVTESMSLSGNAKITIAQGASLELYFGETSGDDATLSIGGNGIVNLNGNSTKMSIYGLNTANVVKIHGNGGYLGTLYAPYAQLQGKGGGSDVDDFMGAAIVASVSYNGHVNFHYDEQLGDIGGETIWRVASWTEL